MNKVLKGAGIVIGIIILLGIIFFTVDYYRLKNNETPIFVVKGIVYRDGGTTEYLGLGYKIIDYNMTNGYDEIKFGSWFMKYDNFQGEYSKYVLTSVEDYDTDSNNSEINIEPEERKFTEQYDGIVEAINGNTIHYRDIKSGETNKKEWNAKDQIFNAVTDEEMTLNQIAAGDYIFTVSLEKNDIKVARNIFGNELKNEILKAFLREPWNVYVGIKDIEYRNSNEEALVTFEVESPYYEELGKEIETFEFKLIINKDTKLYSHDRTNYLELEKQKDTAMSLKIIDDTINSQYPIVEVVEIYDN